MWTRVKRRLIPATVLALLLAAQTPLFAQTLGEIQAEQSQLQGQLKRIEAQIADYEKQLKSIKGQKNTLARRITELNAERAKLQLQIQESQTLLQDTDAKIAVTQVGIEAHTGRLDVLKVETDAVLRELFKQDRRDLIDILLAGKDLSDFFGEVSGFMKLNASLAALDRQYKTETESLRDQRQHLAEQKDHQTQLYSIMQLQNKTLADGLSEQGRLLKETKGKEANYQGALADNKKQAAAIKNRIYTLIAVGKQVTFGEAVKVAVWASSQTGVRPAFLLAILTQESNLGTNVGTCNRKGDPASKGWRAIMKPERDQAPFQSITKALGRDPDTTPVSCPMRDKAGNRVGWGGAMGPAQFIPSTWQAYAPKISAVTGKTADPWDMRDAFLATALKSKADGATTQSGEWAAAMKYFSGSTNVAYRFYGDSVVAQAAKYQKDIDDLDKG